MDSDIVLIPLKDNIFNENKKELTIDYLEKFFGDSYNFSFVIDEDDNSLCLKILKIR